MNLTIYTDGAARGNPGQSGIGVIVYNEQGEAIEEYCEYLGTATNNVAEYRALIAGLTLAKKYLPCSIQFYMDSELLVQQMLGKYRVKNDILSGYFNTAQQMIPQFSGVNFTHIPREKNKYADRLANKAIDAKVTPGQSFALKTQEQ